jgi:hypothetical protein
MQTGEDEGKERDAEWRPRARARRFDRIEDIIERPREGSFDVVQTPIDSDAR